MRSGTALPLRRMSSLVLLTVAATVTLPAVGRAQAIAAGSTGPAASRVDIFAGYGYFYPFNSDIGNIKYPSVPLGAVGSIAGYFGKNFGLQVEGNYAPNGPDDNNCVYSAQAGPIVRVQRGRLAPFFHALGGAAIVGGPRGQKCDVWGWGGTAGLGVDMIMPVLHDRLALRPIQADFVYAQINNGPLSGGGFYGGLGQVYAVRVSAGLTLRLGDIFSPRAAGPGFSCSADPGDPYPGDPVTLTTTGPSINPKRMPRYLWSSTGGHISGQGPTAAIDTSGLAPGIYQVNGQLVEGSKPRLIGSCSTSFTVRAYETPSVACSADHPAINSGDPVIISASARSPQNRPLTFSYTASNGMITGNGPTAALNTAGVSPGNITVTCKVMDDRGGTASSQAVIVVATPAPPTAAVAAAQMQPLCSITFDRDRKRPDRVDNEAKGCLDDVALTLNRQTDAKLLIVGTHADNEANRDAAIRAMNAAQYLTDEKGIDPARLDLRIGPNNARSASLVLLPPGAVVDEGTSTSFDTSSVKRTGQPYGKPAASSKRRRKSTPLAATPQ